MSDINSTAENPRTIKLLTQLRSLSFHSAMLLLKKALSSLTEAAFEEGYKSGYVEGRIDELTKEEKE